MLLFAGIFLLVYAYLPIQVNLNVEGLASLHKQDFFYKVLLGVVVINVLLRVLIHVGLRGINDRLFVWISSFIFIFNLYVTLLIGFIGVANNPLHFTANSYSYLTYLGPLMLIAWMVGLVYQLIVIKTSSSR